MVINANHCKLNMYTTNYLSNILCCYIGQMQHKFGYNANLKVSSLGLSTLRYLFHVIYRGILLQKNT